MHMLTLEIRRVASFIVMVIVMGLAGQQVRSA